MMDMPAPDRYLPAADVRRLLPGALTRPAQEGARLLALHWLHQLVDARQAWQTLPQTVTSDESDPAHHEATRKAAAADVLHRARVALRRLRATLREHDSVLDGTIDRRLARALRALGQATNDVRDSDVQRAWLEAEHDHLPDEARAEAQRLRERLERRSQRASTDVESAFRRHFDPIVERLLGRLSTYRLLKRVGGGNAPTPYARHLASRLARSEGRLRRDLERLRDPHAEAEMHRLRIRLKRQRALLAPFARTHAALGNWFDRATRGQDLLGAIRDAQLLAHRAHKAELPALEQALRDTMLAHHAAFVSDWVDRPSDIAESLAAAITELRAMTAPRASGGLPLEIERKFLLRECPPIVRALRPTQIDQGWLPGKALKERLRRRVEPDGTVSCWRTIKLGPVEARIEVEEAASADLFASLWPLTRQSRVRKERYTIAEGVHHWEIDVFRDRQLVLAEIELQSMDEAFEVPGWLAPYIVRDVTGETAYFNSELARPEA